MAYQGRKVFVAGQVLTASDMNSTVDQTVMVFADAAARDVAIPIPTEGMVVYLKSDNSILKYDSAAWVDIIPAEPAPTIITDATTARTITASDAGATIIFTSASATTITVNASTGFTAGQRVDFIQDGEGVITITAATATVAGNGTTTTSGSFTMGTRFSAATLFCAATDSYRLIGNVAAV